MAMESVMASLSTALASPARGQSTSSSRSGDNTGVSYQGANDMSSGYQSLRNQAQMNSSRGIRASNVMDKQSVNSGSNNNSSNNNTSRARKSRRRTLGAESNTAPTAATIPVTNTCRCLNIIVNLLEILGATSTCNTPVSMDSLLGVLRYGLARCKGILACDHYGTTKGVQATLVMLACQNMATMYDQVVINCVAMLEDMIAERYVERGHGSLFSPDEEDEDNEDDEGDDHNNQDESTSVHHLDVPGGQDNPQEMWFSRYRIESTCERMHVLTTIATVQLTEFAQLLANLRTRAIGKTRQIMILTEAQNKMILARRRLRDSIDKAIATKERDL